MKFYYKQKDGSVFKSKCPSWIAFFSGKHKPKHLDMKLSETEHLVICERCKRFGYVLNKK